MRWNTFIGSLVFGAVAAAAYEPVVLLLGDVTGYRSATAVYLILVAAAYMAGMVSDGARGLRAAFLTGTLLTIGAAITGSPLLVGAGAIATVGLVRSGYLYRGAFGRSVLIEGGLFVGSVLLAGYLLEQGRMGGALAVWGVVLVQSLYFLVGPSGLERTEGVRRDAFEVARSRALALLES
ncbi:MAG: hypothetical protein AAF654_01790 [Myxococcota bacterium]